MVDSIWDRIYIRDLLLRCVLGLTSDERRDKQDVVINLTLYGDLRGAGRSDRVEAGVDYKAIKKDVIAVVEGSAYHLVEALAERIAHLCLSYAWVQKVEVTIDKPGALRFARSVAVEVIRTRADEVG